MDPHLGRPFVYRVGNTETWGGFEVEIVRYLAEKLGRKIELVSVSWDDLPAAVVSGKIDLALNAIEKPQSHQIPESSLPEQVLFTEHYYTAFQQLVVRKKDSFTYNLSDLKGKKVGVIRDSVSQVLLDDLNRLKQAGLKVIAYEQPERLFQDLAAAKLHAVLSERALAGWFIFKIPDLRLTGEPITTETPYVGLVHRENQPLLEGLNKILREARKDAAFMQIFLRWHVSITR
jgi:ABC-type amino acid transport substrate-binding protein